MGFASGATASSGLASQLPPLDVKEPAAWIKSVYASFVDLFPKILGIQHEAATIAATTTGATHDIARKVVDGCAELIRIQAKTQKEVESYSGYLGLGSVVVVGGAIAFASLALIILWCFRRYDALDSTLAAVKAGQLTPDQADNLLASAGPLPYLSVLGGIGFGTILGAAALLAGLLWLRRRRSNPDLVTIGANPQPEGIWSRRVLSMDYIHDDDGQAYRHKFRPGVRMRAMEDGSVRLFNPRKRIWKEF